MDQRLSALAPILASAVVGAWTTLVNSLRMLITIDVRTYQPEKYYMRGPGPKWREKHDRGHLSALRPAESLAASALDECQNLRW